MAEVSDQLENNVYIIQPPDAAQYAAITQRLTDTLRDMHDINVTQMSPDQIDASIDDKTALIVSVGDAAMASTDKHYPSSRKLYISSYPRKQRTETVKHPGNAFLYMTQPYCRQLKMIRLIGEKWRTIGLLYTEKNASSIETIRACGDEFDLDLYAVRKETDGNLSDVLKDVLAHSDVLLALPDANIYNGNTAKNILLTSYRFRKPVIAFSENFVTAGALASIHSDTGQIAYSAGQIIHGYFQNGNTFEQTEYYPERFDIDINKHVVKALGLTHPNIDSLESILDDPEYSGAGIK